MKKMNNEDWQLIYILIYALVILGIILIVGLI